MLITKKFIMINFPKTGSTFARKALLRIHAPNKVQRVLTDLGLIRPGVKELIMPQLFFNELMRQSNPGAEQHAAYIQVPEQYRNRTIMSVVRDPLDRIVSLYEFRSWERKPFPSLALLKERFPSFPQLSFEEFLEMYLDFAAAFTVPEGMNVTVGPLTCQFIRFYARDPLYTMLALREDTDLVRDWDKHFPRITFLHTEGLSMELYDFLLKVGYAPAKVAFIKEMEKVNTTTRSRSTYITAQLVEKIHYSERFFYQIFPEYLLGEGCPLPANAKSV